MGSLLLATLALVATHLLSAWPGLKTGLTARFGAAAYRAAYSLLSLAALVWLVLAWQAAPSRISPLDLGAAAKQAAVVLMPLAWLLILARLTTRPPGPSPAPDSGPASGAAARGIYSITAVPGSLGVLLWSLLHLFALSDLRSTIVFAGFALIALVALLRNLHAAPAPLWAVGWLPFRAALAGRVRPDLRGVGIWRPALALLLWAALLYLHPWIIGPDPAAYLGL
ncbi:NnrU family protein [Oleisolibacter albus]|uniref:NnrU family protein n=1 Tax=Oleisolibacter albus TaxID=2171757 RepID=UPI00139018E1|nr:NnrU family protein [Oleisolibacter albus]